MAKLMPKRQRCRSEAMEGAVPTLGVTGAGIVQLTAVEVALVTPPQPVELRLTVEDGRMVVLGFSPGLARRLGRDMMAFANQAERVN